MNTKKHMEVLNDIVNLEKEIDSILMRQLEDIIFNEARINDLLKQLDEAFIKELLITTIIRFKKSRESSNLSDMTDSNYALNSTQQILYFNLLKKLSNYSNLLTYEFNILINSNDDWLISTGYELLNQTETKTDTSLINRTLELMRANGVNHRPYSEGASLAKSLDKNHKLYDHVIALFNSENENFQQSILATFSMCKQLPAEAEALILNTIVTTDEELKSCAVMATENCKILRNEAISLLVKELDNKHWFIRGNAAGSLGRLKVEDPEIIIKITELLGDTYGHDWSAQEAAITALGHIGKPAKIAVPNLLKLLEEKVLDDFGSTEMEKLEICDVLGKIDDGSKDVITILITVFKSSETVAVTGALRALSNFGSKSKKVLPFVKKYVYEDEYIEGDYLTDDGAELSLLKSLLKIDGSNSQMLNDYINKLKNSSYHDDRVVAVTFEKNLQYG